MTKLFLSYHFDPEIVPLIDQLKRLINSHDLEVVEGTRLGGQLLMDGVKKLIESCDAIIIFLSKREEGRTNDWVKAERALAYSLNIPFISIVEKGVPNNGPFEAFEYIPYDSVNFINPLLSISETISKWKFESGELIRAFVEPSQVEEVLRANFDRPGVVEYRFLEENRSMEWTDWKEAKVIPQQGGVSLFLPGVKRNAPFQIKVTADGKVKTSDFVNQALRIIVPWE